MSGETALRERAQLLDELCQIVQSMKNLAFAELQRVSRMKQAQTLAHEAVQHALQAMPLVEPGIDNRPEAKTTWLVLGAERGFCGAFNAQLTAAVNALRKRATPVTLLVASHRLLTQLEDTQGGVTALPGCATSEEADLVLDAWLDTLSQAIRAGDQIWLMHVGGEGLVRQRLWPLAPIPQQPVSTAPTMYLPAQTLRETLTRQALRLAMQAALYASLEQENHWRLAQMQRARDHLDEMGEKLRRRYAGLRQTHITGELQTLMGAESAQVPMH
jgi:F-type H+-transporting ATPase subunit gamma